MSTRYESAKEIFASYGVDTDAVIAKLKEIPVAVHCWQGDDVKGFDQDGPLTGGIQTTGNYPGKAMTPEQLMQDMEKVIYLADMLCEERKFDGKDYLLGIAKQNLDRAMLASLQHSLEWIKSKGNTIDTDSLDALQYFEKMFGDKCEEEKYE